MKKMIFNRNMYYHDQLVPLYVKGKVYDVEDDMVPRWIKRGGEIVEDSPAPAQEVEAEKPVEAVEPVLEKPVEPKRETPKPPTRHGSRK